LRLPLLLKPLSASFTGYFGSIHRIFVLFLPMYTPSQSVMYFFSHVFASKETHISIHPCPELIIIHCIPVECLMELTPMHTPMGEHTKFAASYFLIA